MDLTVNQGYADATSASGAYTYLHLNTNMKKQIFTFIKDLDCDGLCVILTPDDQYMICESNCLENLKGEEIELSSLKEGSKVGEPSSGLLVFDKDSFFSVINKLNEIKRL